MPVGLSTGPREDYVAPKSYRRDTDVGAVAKMVMAQAGKSSSLDRASALAMKPAVAAKAVTDTALVLEAVRQGAKSTTEIAARIGFQKHRVVKIVSNLVRQTVLRDLPRKPGEDRLVELADVGEHEGKTEDLAQCDVTDGPRLAAEQTQIGKGEDVDIDTITKLVTQIKADLDAVVETARRLEERAEAGEKASEELAALRETLKRLVP
ncbi:hypothetical protein RU820_05025 [Acidithiobacillus ferrooxidans]|uniref:hypothetical protein n=1 Tax=Acidithiobacillus TaxID=119977 RepID=UPI0011D12CBA|nr:MULTISPECIES: hypothetical protein [Acidithiobacillus]MBN6744945.1 hypothetical protein [Acidithiobacillus sp. MC2.2]MBN6747871.1 hypothetical protein [Acidithiobacillus sp. PG05]